MDRAAGNINICQALPPGAGKRWLLRSAAAAAFPSGLRCVCVPRAELRALPELLDACRAHPRARFALLIEMPLSLAPFAEFHNELSAALDGGGSTWPAGPSTRPLLSST